MSRTKAQSDAETTARVARSTAFIRWLWLHLEGSDERRQVVMLGVLDRMHEVRLDALLDATAMARNVLDVRPSSEEAQAIERALRELTDAQRQVVEAAKGDDAS